MFWPVKQVFVGLLISKVNPSNHTKCISLTTMNQQWITQPTLINLHLNEYGQGLCYYPFAVNLDRCKNKISWCKNKIFYEKFFKNKFSLQELVISYILVFHEWVLPFSDAN